MRRAGIRASELPISASGRGRAGGRPPALATPRRRPAGATGKQKAAMATARRPRWVGATHMRGQRTVGNGSSYTSPIMCVILSEYSYKHNTP